MAFSYLRDRDAGVERTLWNCARTPRPDRRQCMKQQVLLTATPVTAATPVPAATPAGPVELTGVRRKDAPAAQPVATPRPSAFPQASSNSRRLAIGSDR